MTTRRAFCSACDRNVPVIFRPRSGELREPSLHDAEDLVCLEYGVRCTGAMCPLFSVSMPEEEGRPRPDAAGPTRS